MTERTSRGGSADGVIDRHVGQIVRQRRKALGMSQAALAEALGVSFQQIQKYERGANRVSAPAMWRLAAALHCQPGDFFAGLTSAHRSQAADPEGFGPIGRAFLASDGGLELARAFLAAALGHRRALLAAARAFALEQDG